MAYKMLLVRIVRLISDVAQEAAAKAGASALSTGLWDHDGSGSPGGKMVYE
jgi:hypothetical protein